MEATIYDKDFSPTRIIDSFTSILWNDVYIGYGDFEIEFVMDDNGLAYIDEGYYVSIKESNRYMIIESIEIATSFTDGNVCRLSGRSLESILTRRILRNETLVKGNLQQAILRMLNENIISASNPNRNVEGFSMKLSTDPRITSMTLDANYEIGDNLYDVIYKICEERKLGFRVMLHEERFFQFELYMGIDRSYQQAENPWVVFSPKFENLEESDMKIDLTKHKNCMEIDYETNEAVTKPNGGDEEKKVIIPIIIGDDAKGLERREIYGSSNFEVDKIDKSSFGTAAQRVDKMKYMSWQMIGFNSAGYNAAMKEWHAKNDDKIAQAAKPQTKTVTYTLKPGDPGYKDTSESGPNASWINTRTETVTETKEEAAKRSSAYISSVSSTQPRRSSYEEWGWDFTDAAAQAAYNAEVAKAQKDIDNEYAAAVAAALNYAKSIVAQQGVEELGEYQEISSFDGKIDPNVNFIYRRDYDLGDIVQVVNAYHFNAVTRVSSVLFSHDDVDGVVVRPTFESDNKAVVDFDLEDYEERSWVN